MIIKNKVVWIHDIEIFPNLFICGVKNSETEEIITFEISVRKNNIKELINFYLNTQDKIMCGYNVIHYDNPIINFILDKQQAALNAPIWQLCNTLYNLSSEIVNSDGNFSKWSKWKYAKNFYTLDLLTMLFSQKLRVGLKEMQVTMQFFNVQEYNGDFSQPCPKEDIDKVILYNNNDLNSTEELLNRCESQINLRLSIEEEYGVDVLSKDGMTIGTEILKLKYLEKTGKSWYEIKDLRSPCDYIDLNKVILPFIKYDTPVLQKLLVEMKQQVVSPGRKGYEKHFLLGDLEISVGVGGIHSINKPEIIIPKSTEELLDSDVNSLYPSLIISYGIVPKHLGKEFLEIYGQVREERLEAKRNKQKVKNETLKLALNGATGNFQNEYSWLYDPEAVMRIRINGQLLLLMLCEKILQAGGKIKQVNTDGVLYLFDKQKHVELETILHKWEDLTKLTLETEEFEAFYQYAINDYLAIGKGYKETKDPNFLKKKGLFIDKVTLGKGMQPMIIPYAINQYFANNISVDETVRNCKDLNMFITYQKVSKDYQIEYNKELITHINRYYMSTDGYYLYKCKVEPATGRRYEYIIMNGDSGITIVNDLSIIKEFPKNINYRYYIKEANKIIFDLKQTQLSLF